MSGNVLGRWLRAGICGNMPDVCMKDLQIAEALLRRTPHPVIVAIRDNRDYSRVLLYSYYTTITGWGILPRHYCYSLNKPTLLGFRVYGLGNMSTQQELKMEALWGWAPGLRFCPGLKGYGLLVQDVVGLWTMDAHVDLRCAFRHLPVALILREGLETCRHTSFMAQQLHEA